MKAVLVWNGRLSGGVRGFSGRIQNLVDDSFFPCHTILLMYMINNLSLFYDTLQPASHDTFMDNKELWASPGTTCDCVASLRVHGRSKFPVRVDYSVLPSSRCMTSALTLLSGAPGKIKFPIAPESIMAWLTAIFIFDVLNRVFCF